MDPVASAKGVSSRMNPEIKAAWVQWLRDNANKQGTGRLKREGKFCCLGGLCELAKAAGVVRAELVLTGEEVFRYVSFEDDEDFSKDVLPRAVAVWAGLPASDRNPVVKARESNTNLPEEEVTLVTLNDNWRLNFNQIADLIEQQL